MKRDADLACDRLLDYLRTHHRGLSRRWFDDLSIGRLDSGQLEIVAGSPDQLQYLANHCGHAFREAAQSLTGRLVTVEFTSSGGNPVAPIPTDAGSAGSPTRNSQSPGSPAHLNGNYTFENLVVGPCNRLAHAACRAVADAPGTAYNPLFFHGDVGLGKTHMLQAICHELLDQNPAATIVYLSCEAFLNQFIDAVKTGDLVEFRDRHRHVDLLAIDDIQFLVGREQTQEEFFHTFNALYQVNKQIVLSGDAPPSKMKGIENRLVSRFNWGLVARLDTPCLETRNAILRKKMGTRDMNLSDEITMFIASETISNTRELEGVLNRLHGMAALEGRSPDMEMAREALGQALPHSAPSPRIPDIAAVVIERFSVKLAELQGKRRSRSIALPRQICMYLAREMTPHSLEEIGGFFGGRDHTTVLYAHRLIGDRMKDDLDLRGQVQHLERRVRHSTDRARLSASA